MKNTDITLKIKETVMKIGSKSLIFGKKTYIMGILNVTPDSFSDGGDFVNVEKALEHAKEMIRLGADMIDVGGESTRPGFQPVSVKEELERVIPMVKRLSEETDTIISVDTTKAEIARAAVENGAHIINDIWGLRQDSRIIQVVAEHQIPIIIMHNQDGTEYKEDMLDSIKSFLQESIDIALNAGLKKENIILDPGIGFGKTSEQNMQLMANLFSIREMGYPVLLGTSRKSMIGKILDVPPKERGIGTAATTVMGIMQGMDIVRVHDIKESFQAAKVTDAIVRRTNG